MQKRRPSSNEKETDIQKQCLEALEKLGWFAWRNNSTGVFDASKRIYRKAKSKYSINGVSDIIAIKKGVHVFIEVKKPNGKQSESQKIFERNVTNNGGKYYIATCVNDIIEINRQIFRHKTPSEA